VSAKLDGLPLLGVLAVKSLHLSFAQCLYLSFVFLPIAGGTPLIWLSQHVIVVPINTGLTVLSDARLAVLVAMLVNLFLLPAGVITISNVLLVLRAMEPPRFLLVLVQELRTVLNVLVNPHPHLLLLPLPLPLHRLAVAPTSRIASKARPIVGVPMTFSVVTAIEASLSTTRPSPALIVRLAL
jgi:hypothetical protein